MIVREAAAEDIEAIREVAKRSWAVDYPDILTRETVEEGVDDWYAVEQLEAELTHARTQLFVAERDEVVVGFAHASWGGEEGYIMRLYVHPDHRWEGVGQALLVRTCRALSEVGVERVSAMVLTENDPGRAFYERFGFEQADESETTIGGETYRENRYVLTGEVTPERR
ncbi:GNAT family N-acetyltransferase [Natronomonas sp. EA1]|uniref:GNAT family N-acetyltransferase n=1 Tax=Natronomonas sp. EA1 TaxID=3421655 RepID=UPI003EBDDF78